MPDALDWVIIGLMGACLIEGGALWWLIRSERKLVRETRHHFIVDFQIPKFPN